MGNTRIERIVGQVHVPTSRSGGELVAKTLLENGVDHVFTLTGGHIAPILVGCQEFGISVVDVRDEAAAVFAADATGRISSVPGVAIVTAGPGLSNSITAIKNAQLAQSPLLVLVGATSGLLKGRGSLQDIDQISMVKPHVKATFSISRVYDIVPILRKSFTIAKNGVPGPVFIEFPLDSIWPKHIIEKQLLPDSLLKFPPLLSTEGIAKRLEYLYLRRYFDNLFHNAFQEHSPFRQTVSVPFGVEHIVSSISPMISVLQNSVRPVLVIGSQTVEPCPKSIKALIDAIEFLEIPVYLSGMARGLLGASHPLQHSYKRSETLKQADFVCLLGVPMDFRMDYGRHISSKAFFVMANLCKETLERNSDIRSRSYSLHCSSLEFLIQLSSGMRGNLSSSMKECWNAWNQQLSEKDLQRDEEINQLAQGSTLRISGDSSLVNSVYLCQEIDKALDDNSIIIADGGDFIGTASYIIKPRQPLSWLDPGVFGTLGVGGGFALACKKQNPESEVWLLYGDGSSAWSLAEFDTMKRCKLPVIAVIGNDACWMQMHRDQIKMLANPVATELEYTRYDQVVEGYGGVGILVTRNEEIAPALLKAKSIAKQGTPVLINVLMYRSNFRDGSISL